MDSNDVATVLEEAARGYRDEKYEWCAGSWVESNEGEASDGDATLSACAEGALLYAAGFTWQQVEAYGDSNSHKYNADNHSAYVKFSEAKEAVTNHIRQHADEYLLGSYEWEIPEWNDSLESMIVDKIYEDHEDQAFGSLDSVFKEASVRAKAMVINAMEATAKDLRNG